MMRVPMLALWAYPVSCAAAVNGAVLGEAGPDAPLVFPVSEGTYYVTMLPLMSGVCPITSRLVFEDGRLYTSAKAYCWPDGVFEVAMRLKDGAPAPETRFEGEMATAFAFLHAVRTGNTQAARAYLMPALNEGLDDGTMQAFFGAFSECRAPVAGGGDVIGLVGAGAFGAANVKPYRFLFEKGLISDIFEL